MRGSSGVYYCTVTIRDGARWWQMRRYEITYLESDGRRRQQAVKG